jgi:hypothetical protein
VQTAAAQNAADSEDARTIIAAIENTRARKDSLLRYGADSPLRPEDLPSFKGLQYYAIDLEYRLVGQMHIYGRQRQIEVPDTGGSTITMERFGRLYTSWRGKEFWFEVYRSVEGAVIEAFFKDQSNGDSTYSGGRYVRIAPLPNGDYLIDFNMAYNPYCDYNIEYICPMPPLQNHLPFAIAAGELDDGTDLAH